MTIYFDHSATTPVDPRVVETMLPFWQEQFGNPSNLHGTLFHTNAVQAVGKIPFDLSTNRSRSVPDCLFTHRLDFAPHD